MLSSEATRERATNVVGENRGVGTPRAAPDGPRHTGRAHSTFLKTFCVLLIYSRIMQLPGPGKVEGCAGAPDRVNTDLAAIAFQCLFHKRQADAAAFNLIARL